MQMKDKQQVVFENYAFSFIEIFLQYSLSLTYHTAMKMVLRELNKLLKINSQNQLVAI